MVIGHSSTSGQTMSVSMFYFMSLLNSVILDTKNAVYQTDSDSNSLFTKFYKESVSKSGKHMNISTRQH